MRHHVTKHHGHVHVVPPGKTIDRIEKRKGDPPRLHGRRYCFHDAAGRRDPAGVKMIVSSDTTVDAVLVDTPAEVPATVRAAGLRGDAVCAVTAVCAVCAVCAVWTSGARG